MTPLLLELRGVTRRFGGVLALRNVSFTVPAGQVVGLIGPNGSGKTTLMNVISGVDRPTSGSVLLDGVAVEGMPAHRLVRLGIARTFQHIRLVGELTAGENVALALHGDAAGPLDVLLRTARHRRVEAAQRDRAHVLLARAGIGQHVDTAAGDLSYGDRRRVEIARALAAEPRLLLLDEPAAGMTHGERAGLRDLIAGLPALGVTVLLIEHDMDLVMGICDELRVLNLGAPIAAGSPAAIRADPRVVEAYLGADDA